MAVGEMVNFAGVVLVGIGLMVTWYRNGRSASEKYGALTEQVKESNKKLDSHSEKLDAIQASVNEQKINCATISTGLKERIGAVEREVQK